MTDRARTGACLCGAVAFTVTPSDPHVLACHCKMCRRQTSHFLATVSVAASDLAITEPRGLKWYQSSPHARRGFCGECGSALFWTDDQGNLGVSAGALDDDTGLRLHSHIYVADKGAYYDIADDQRQYPGDDAAAP